VVNPKVLLNGEPVVTSGKENIAPSTFSDANNYYIFYSYTGNIGEIQVQGQNSIPEFPSVPVAFITIMLFLSVFSIIAGKNSEKKLKIANITPLFQRAFVSSRGAPELLRGF